jgi:hypothetical protein
LTFNAIKIGVAGVVGILQEIVDGLLDLHNAGVKNKLHKWMSFFVKKLYKNINN